MIEQETEKGNNGDNSRRYGPPLLIGCVSVAILASIFLIGLGLGYGTAQWTDASTAGGFLGSSAGRPPASYAAWAW